MWKDLRRVHRFASSIRSCTISTSQCIGAGTISPETMRPWCVTTASVPPVIGVNSRKRRPRGRGKATGCEPGVGGTASACLYFRPITLTDDRGRPTPWLEPYLAARREKVGRQDAAQDLFEHDASADDFRGRQKQPIDKRATPPAQTRPAAVPSALPRGRGRTRVRPVLGHIARRFDPVAFGAVVPPESRPHTPRAQS